MQKFQKVRRYKVSVFLGFAVTFFIMFILLAGCSPRRYEPPRLGAGWVEFAFRTAQMDHGYFDDIESVFYNVNPTEEIVRFEYENYIFAILSGGFGNRERCPFIRCFSIILQPDGRYLLENYQIQDVESQLTLRGTQGWSDQDRVARDIVFAYTQENFTALVNGQVPIYFGAGVGEIPIYISILGYEPDNIIPFIYKGRVFFLWYYLTMDSFGEILESNFDLSVTIMMADVIELFDIQVIRE